MTLLASFIIQANGSAASEPLPKGTLRAGIIGCDTSHVPAFATLLNAERSGDDPLSGVRVVAAFPGGSDDIASSRDRVEGFTEQLREMGIEIVPTIAELLQRVDVVLLESSDGRKHLEQVRPVIEAGKPVFIDKPFAASVADAEEIFSLAKKHNVPIFSSSMMRFAPEIAAAYSDPAIGEVVGCDAYSPCKLDATHPDLFWYGIHGVETLFTVMGPGCERVSRTHTEGTELVTGVWKDGRIGSFRGIRDGKHLFGALVLGSKGIKHLQRTGAYDPLVAEIVKFFKSGKPPVSPHETLEILAFMEAAELSKTENGRSVALQEVLSDTLAKKPNIVFILADDLGYGELGCYGQDKIRTPNIDRLASQGMRLMQHYTGAPVCAPARCTLMTGQHLGHAEIRSNRKADDGRQFPGEWPITDGIVTIAETLKSAGYATGAFGKWGLGNSDSSGSPNRQGFDRFYGYLSQGNAHSYYPPYLNSDDKEVTINDPAIPGHQTKPTGEVNADDYRGQVYAPDRIMEEAVDWLGKNKDKPFFLYLPFIEPHVSLQPPQEWIDQYPQQWDEEHGAYRGQNGYLPHPRPRAAYAALISDLDEHVGIILDQLDHLGLTDNTIVIFTSDNGPTHPRNDDRWHVGGAACTFFNSAGGLRGYKGSCYEGGLRMPCIVRWPGQVKPGSESEMVSYFPDWFPTLAKIGGAALPTNQQLDGIDLTPEFRGQNTPQREQPLIWEFAGYGGIVAIRDGQWKAVRRDVMGKSPRPWELYDLANDRNEVNDLAASHPEIVQRLDASFRVNRTVEPDFPQPLFDTQ